MADVTFTIGIKDDGTPVLRNIKREVEGMGTGAERAATRASGAFGAMQRSVQEASRSTQILANTLSGIGRTAGLLGVVGSAATLVLLLKDAVTAGIQYNAKLEQQSLGIASIVTATTNIVDAQGKTLQGIEKFNAAQEISAALMQQIQQDALKTTATSEQLVEAFQSAVGPLTAAGLSLDQSRDATLRIVQAAFALGIPMHQVAQEVRAIAEGSIDVNARVAKTLDITNEQVQSLKEQGKLYEFIVQKTEAFSVAGAKTEQSFSGLASSIADISAQILGLSTSTFFEELKSQMRGLLSLLTAIRDTFNDSGESGLEKQIQRVSRQLQNTREHINFINDHPLEFEGVQDNVIAVTTKRIADLEAQLKDLTVEWGLQESAASGAKGALETYTVIAQGAGAGAGTLAKEQEKLSESIVKQIASIKRHGETLNLSGAALADYAANEVLATIHSKDLAEQMRKAVLIDEAAKEKKEAVTKAEQAKTKAVRDAAREAKKLAKAEEDLREEEERNAEGILKIVDALDKDAATRAERLGQLQEEITQLEEEGRLLQAALGPRAALLKLEKEIALAREDRATASALAADGEKKLGAAEQANILKAGELRKKNIELADSNDKIAEAQKKALLTTNDLRDGFRDMIDALLKRDWKGALDVIERKGKELGARLIEGFVFGKGDVENKVLIPNFEEVFGQGNTLGGIISKAGNWLGQLFGREMSSGIQGSLAGGGGIFGGAGTGDSIGAGGIFGGAGNAGTAGGKAGSAYGDAFSYAAIAGMAIVAGKDFAKGKYGSGAGAIVGGAIGASFGPQGAALGAMVGKFLGSFLDPLFKHMPTKGTLIRKGVQAYLKEIGVSFAKEIDSADYFFEETKKLGSKMFGGDFLAASKQILTDKAGPEIAKQLQALGTAITAAQAIKLGKSLEQTGTTFGNMLLDNLGLDEIPAAIAEIVQKGDFTFANLTTKLTEVFQKNKIGVDFYKDTIQGAVDLFYGDLPEAIHASAIALKSFTDGAFDVKKFEENLEDATNVFNLVIQSFRDAIANSDTGTQAAELFGAQLKAGLEALAIEAYLTQFIDEKLFAGIDLGNGLDSSEIELLTARTKEARIAVESLRDAFAGTATNADTLVARIRDLQAAIQEIANERIEIRLQLLDDFASIGLGTALDAIAARIESIQDRITQIIGEGGGSRPLSELTDEDLTHLIRLQAELRNAILARYREEAAAIQAAAQAQIAAIREEYAAKRTAIQEAINRLQEQRAETQRLFQAQIDALQEQLRVAEAFRGVVESINDMIRAAVQSPQSPLDPQQQLGFLQREEAALRAKLVGATGAERVRLIQELAQILQQQLQFVDRNTVNGQQLFRDIIRELTVLRDEAAKEADKAADLQRQIAAATLAMDAALKSIDAQIAAQQKLLADLSAQEAAAIAAVEATAKAQLEALRKETAQQLLDLARKTDEAKVEQLRRLEAQLATAKEQLISAVGAEQATKLLAVGDQAHLVIQAQQLATLHSIDAHILDAFNQLNENSQNAVSMNTVGSTSLLAGSGEASKSGGPTGSVTITFAPVVNVTVEPGEEQRVKSDMDEIMRLAEQRFGRKLETDWAPKIRRIAEGGI